MKKVDFFKEWAKQFEPGYKGPWIIDNVKPDDLFICSCFNVHYDDSDCNSTNQSVNEEGVS